MERKVYTKDFKEEAVRLVTDQGIHIKQAAAALGVSRSAMRKWAGARRSKGAGAFPGSGNLSPEDRRVREL